VLGTDLYLQSTGLDPGILKRRGFKKTAFTTNGMMISQQKVGNGVMIFVNKMWENNGVMILVDKSGKIGNDDFSRQNVGKLWNDCNQRNVRKYRMMILVNKK